MFTVNLVAAEVVTAAVGDSVFRICIYPSENRHLTCVLLLQHPQLSL